MSRLAALVAIAALAAVPSAGIAGGAQPFTPVAGVAKKCGKHKRHHHKGHKHRRCKRGQSGGGGAGGGGVSGSGGGANCANTAASPGRAAAFESEYTIQLSRPSVGCGTVILEQNTTTAMDPHNLVLQKEGDPAPSYSYDQLDPGLYARQTLNLSRGNWVLYCSLSNHRALGMEVTLVVN